MAIEFRRDGPWELPEGWVWARLGDLGRWVGGGTPSKSNAAFWMNGTIPWISPKDMKKEIVGDSPDRITQDAVAHSTTNIVPANSVLMVVRSGILKHTFPVAVSDREVTINQDMRALIPKTGISARYLAFVLKRLQQNILDECSKDGTTVASVEPSRLEDSFIPLAPAAEQVRIVTRINELFTEIIDGEIALARARDDLDTWRRALLKAAVTGELTREWRQLNKPSDTASDILERIRQTRSRGNANSDRSRFYSLDTSHLPDLPANWAWSTLPELCVHTQRNGISIKGTSNPPGVMALRLDALSEDGLNFNAVRYIPLPPKRVPNYVVKKHDFLVSRANGSAELVGRGVYVENIGQTVVFPDTIIRYPVYPCEALGRWIDLAWKSPLTRRQIMLRSKTTAGILKISQDDIAQIAIPVPPKSEMHIAIEAIRMNTGSASEETNVIDYSTRAVAAIRQSLLKAAFEGQLVEQNPKDEPADVLLGRLSGAAIGSLTTRSAPRSSVVTLAVK